MMSRSLVASLQDEPGLIYYAVFALACVEAMWCGVDGV